MRALMLALLAFTFGATSVIANEPPKDETTPAGEVHPGDPHQHPGDAAAPADHHKKSAKKAPKKKKAPGDASTGQ